MHLTIMQDIEFHIFLSRYYRPGGELNTGEDEVEGLKRLLTEVTVNTSLPYRLARSGTFIYR